MTRAWLNGWAIESEALAACCRQAWPSETHRIFPATRLGLEQARAARCEAYGGYSLGALLLLKACAEENFAADDVVLLAPFLAFPAECGRGGRVRRAQLEWVRRKLASDPAGAVEDFRQRADVRLPAAYPIDPAALQEGLVGLMSAGLNTVPHGAQRWRIIVGETDTLLSASVVAGQWTQATLVPGAGHDAGELLAGIRKESHAI